MTGFVGNSLGVGVLWRQGQQQKLSIYWYLGALTLMDIIFLGSGIINSVPSIMRPLNAELAKYVGAHMRLGLTYADNVLLHSARLLVLVMSCERLLSIAIPFRVKDTWLAKYPVRVILGALLFNMTFSSPLLINGTVVKFDTRNMTEYVFTFRNYDKFMSQYWVAEAVVHSFIPTVLLLAINIAMPVQFYNSSVRRRSVLNASSNTAGSQQKKITATVMTITIMNILLSIPIIVVKLLQFVNPDFNMHGKHRLVFWFLADLSKCLAYINAATDFLVFYLVSNNYRAVFKTMYCGYCISQHNNYEKKQQA